MKNSNIISNRNGCFRQGIAYERSEQGCQWKVRLTYIQRLHPNFLAHSQVRKW